MSLKFSPYIYKYKIDSNIICLFNSYNLKKFFCSKKEYNKIIKNVKENNISENIIQLLDKCILENSKAKEIFKNYTSPKVDIVSSYIYLTDACNLNCKYCFESKHKKVHYIKKEDVEKIVNIIKNNASKKVYKNKGKLPYFVIFYGGEPLLNSEIMFYLVEKLKRIENINFAFGINTNGTLITKEIAKKLKKHNFSVCVSLDGWEDINDKARVYKNGKGTYKDSLKGILNLVKEGIIPSISCTLGKHNYEYAPKIVEHFYTLGIREMGFNLIIGNYKPLPPPKKLASYVFEAFKVARKNGMIEDLLERRYRRIANGDPYHKGCFGCGQQICFYPNKKIGPCEAFYGENKFSVPLNDNFIAKDNEIWKEWSKRHPINLKCNCPAISICEGGCPYSSYKKYGSIWQRDNYFCEFMKHILHYLLLYYYEKEICKNNKKL